MQRLTILCVGKLQESWWRDAAGEYEKRLTRYCDLRITELSDEKTPERASAAERDKILRIEGERILKAADPRAPYWALAVQGKRMDSETFAARLGELPLMGIPHLQLVIGGSLGLSPEVLKGAVLQLSFSDMTFPHQLMRVILLEQIYRGFRILRGEPYHK